MKTAVEWLVEKINDQKAWANPLQLVPLIQQAKEMEEEQIIEAWEDGFETSDIFEDDGTNYYNNKFKSE